MEAKTRVLPGAFIWRRLHSLMGLWLVIFLMEHLLTNSQAALLLGDSGKGFIRMVNWLHNLPYLQVIELTLLGIPFLIHGIWGIQYALTGKFNSYKTDGTKPSLRYGRNKGYTWQRITSWLLLFLIIMHVAKFRFLDYPHSVNKGSNPTYFVKVHMDPGLYTVAARLDSTIYDCRALNRMEREISGSRSEAALSAVAEEIRERDETTYNRQDGLILTSAQEFEEKKRLYESLASVDLKDHEVLVASSQFGTATLFSVRDTFKNPWWVGVYTVFVLAAVFHAFNGLWTSMLTWGWMVRYGAQKGAVKFCIGLMLLVGFLGLAAVWGTYFINLKH